MLFTAGAIVVVKTTIRNRAQFQVHAMTEADDFYTSESDRSTKIYESDRLHRTNRGSYELRDQWDQYMNSC